MKIEREYRYVGFDVDSVIIHATRLATPKVIKFKRAVFDIPAKTGWLRLRTDGDNTTLTVKVSSPERPSESFESETTVGDFDDMLGILKILGYMPRSVQNNFRVLFRINNCDFTLDLWPKLPALVEIEGETDQKIEEVESHFDSLRRFRTDKTVSELYEGIGIDVKHAKDLDFDIKPPVIGKIEREHIVKAPSEE